MKNSNAHADLLSMICKKSYREGDFTLSSGAKSTFYIDLKPTLLDPMGAQSFGKCATNWIIEQKLQFDGVAGLTLGADPMVMAVSLMALNEGLSIPAAMIRKEPKKHGTSRYIEGVENFKKNAKILVVEDVVTTGASALKAIDILVDTGFQPTHVLAVVDRGAGGADEFKKLGLKFHPLFTIAEISRAYGTQK